jgi:hypothetical protein
VGRGQARQKEEKEGASVGRGQAGLTEEEEGASGWVGARLNRKRKRKGLPDG